MFHSVPTIIKKLFPSYVWQIPNKEKVIYLTFDDGPVPKITEFVLDELDKFKAQATFFCVGENISNNPVIFQKLLKAEHAVGNHTYNHLKGWQVSNEAYFENIEKCKNSIIQHSTFNIQHLLFRPPYGRIKRSQGKILKEKYKIIMWDVLTCDYDQKLEAEKCLLRAIKATKMGSIVVFHDSVKAEKNLRYVLPKYLAHFSGLGYRFEKIK